MDERKVVGAIVVISLIVAGALAWMLFLQKPSRDLSASGTIEATEVLISSKASGYVLKLLFDEGDKVAKGDIIAQIDNAEISAIYRQAKAQLDLAQSNYARAKELYTKGFASSQTLDEARAGFDAASANLDLAKIRLSDATIRSPASGYVTVKSVEEGELVGPGSPIATVSDLNNVYIMVYLPEAQAGRIKLGEKAFVYADSYPGERFEGRVTYISKQAEFTPKTIQTKEERVTLVFGVKIEIPNAALKLKPGLPGDAVMNI